MKLIVMVPIERDRVFAERLKLPLTELEKHGHQVLWCETIQHALTTLRGASIIVMSRPADLDSIKTIYLARRMGIKTVVDIDDAIHEIPPHNPAYVAWGKDKDVIKQWMDGFSDGTTALPALDWATKSDLDMVTSLAHGRLIALEISMKSADLVTVSTPSIARYYTTLMGLKNVAVVQNGISAKEWGNVERMERADGKFSVRWGGSFTHHDDLEILKIPMERLSRECPDLDFQLMGTGAHGDAQFSFMPKEMFVSKDGGSMDEYKHWLAGSDVILAPSDGSVFARCKSDIRVLHAGWLGIPVVCSPPTYGKTVLKAKMGLVAQNTDMWVRHLMRLHCNKEFRDVLGKSGMDYVKTHRTYENMWTNWERVYLDLIQEK